jgi:hypothetical protein
LAQSKEEARKRRSINPPRSLETMQRGYPDLRPFRKIGLGLITLKAQSAAAFAERLENRVRNH